VADSAGGSCASPGETKLTHYEAFDAGRRELAAMQHDAIAQDHRPVARNGDGLPTGVDGVLRYPVHEGSRAAGIPSYSGASGPSGRSCPTPPGANVASGRPLAEKLDLLYGVEQYRDNYRVPQEASGRATYMLMGLSPEVRRAEPPSPKPGVAMQGPHPMNGVGA